MKSKIAWYLVVILAILVVVLLVNRSSTSKTPPVSVDTTDVSTGMNNTPSAPTGSAATGNTGRILNVKAQTIPVYYAQQVASTTLLIHVSRPPANTTILSPFEISGEARGSWYFEASFPVALVDANGRVLAEGPAVAQSSWQTADFVPFKATLSFKPQKSGSKGKVILMKDNPSGLSKNDAAVEIAVTF